MRLYIKGDYTKRVPFGYRELTWKIWFKERNGQEISLSHVGDDEMLQDDFYLSLRLDKWGACGSRWKDAKVKGGSVINSQIYENIDLDYEGSYESDGREKGKYLRIASNYLDVLTVDKRAMYIMALEIATAIDGKISEDDKKTWLRIEEFKEKHQDILSLTFDEANEMSLEEIQTIDAIDDPIWEELDRKREEYIKIHGERVYDDEDDE
ncbi:hypothetical protein K1I56_01950 [Streptococcus parasanguinis]|uniref:hypothetical protein n=1 Tax=Streptococcus parasanguinis TaxID=1318 RepID=UPI001CBBD9C5|nr:hypothetical protein [Streptococcus parasanguinis]MBZ2078623.1 hypothetical protein [Streptococcus parasanguinis]